ncbi:hypothetical protein [Rhodovulum euryhalinum]|uniref:hypothetical protein n=1 Tax=Rhodovulum euryhalinum TaxID=35805 RepID=UPI001047FD22|nr:hypothetical protein [Rhodovulum euryhalinum]
MRGSIPGCRSLVYADLSARLVLCSDSDLPRPPQEALDALCLRAVRLMTGPVAEAARMALAADLPPGEAVVVQGGGIEVFLRAPTASDEALCAVLDPAADPEVALALLRGGIDAILPGVTEHAATADRGQ